MAKAKTINDSRFYATGDSIVVDKKPVKKTKKTTKKVKKGK